jgi:zinc protease
MVFKIIVVLLLSFPLYAQDSMSVSAASTKKDLVTGATVGSSERDGENFGALTGLKKKETPKSIKLDFEVERVTLANGMVFLLHSQKSIPLVSYHTWFRVGAKDELSGESGLAHMFEHMMFKGTPRYPNKDFDRILQANGIINNAFTNQDYTGYYEILPSSKLELIMDMESDRLQNLQIVDDEFQKEREVVKEERRMRYDNNPGGMGWEKLNTLIYQGSKYELPVIGTMKEINDFDVEKLRRFYKKWYIPSNAVVVIVGDFDIEATKKLITKFYGSLPSSSRPIRTPLTITGPSKRAEESVSFPVQSPELMWAARTIKGGVDDAYALDLLSSILGQGKSSHLFQDLVYQKQVALSAESGHYTMQDSGIFFVQGVAKPGVSASDLKPMLEAEIDKFLKLNIKEEELIKAKNMILSDYVESLKTNDGKAKLLAMNEILFGDYKEFFRDIDRYLKVTLEDLKRVKSYLVNEGRVLITVDAPVKGKK